MPTNRPALARRRSRIRHRSTLTRIECLEARQLLAAVALPDTYNLVQNNLLNVAASGVLANDTLASGNPLSVSANTTPANGTLVLAPAGTFTYVPNPGFVGQDQFNYTASDGVNTASATVTLNVAASVPIASVTAGTRLASVDTTRSALLNGLLGNLVGGGALSTSVLDNNALAQGQVRGGNLLAALQTNLGLASTDQAAAADITLPQLFAAAADAAQAEGNTALVTAFDNLALQVTGSNQTIRLGELINVTPNQGDLADANLNALDLATGAVQLFNFKNVATTTAPVTISGAALGLGSVVNSVALSATVVEPPVFTVGGVGTTFHTAGIRLKLNLDLVDLSPSTAGLNSLLGGALAGPLSNLLSVDSNLTLGNIDLFTTVASGTGTITAIDAISRAVTMQTTPGVANAYLGTISDAVFGNRAVPINPATDIGFGTIGALTIGTSGLINTSGTTAIQARSSALGAAPLAGSLVFTPPYPQTLVDGSSAAFLANLASTLVTNLQVQTSGSLGLVLDPVVNGTILPVVTPLVANTLAPVLSTVLTGVVDPVLDAVGVGIGELVVTVSNQGLVAPPAANPDVATTVRNAQVIIPVLANDASVAGDTITITSVTQPANGTLTVNPDGTITYNPAANYVGPDSFTYTITGNNGTSTGTVTIAVNPVNNPPTAVADTYLVPQNTPLVVAGPGVLGNDFDPEGTALTAALVAGPTNGTLVLNPDGSFTYTPNAGFVGTDSFTYLASDGVNASGPAGVTINVAAAVTTPTALPDTYFGNQGATLTVAAPGVLGNDFSPGGVPLTTTLVSTTTNGVLALSPDGSFTYTPNAGFVGSDTFTYQATDGTNSSGTVSVTLTILPVNNTPTALPDNYTGPQGTPLVISIPGVLSNDSDPNGDPLSAVLVTNGTNGVVVLNPDGSFTYTPNPGFVGTDTFVYQATDGTNTSAPVGVTITITAASNTPIAQPDAYAGQQGTSLVIAGPGVLGNDFDPNGDPLTAVLVAAPSNGVVTLNPDGSFTYTPNAGFVGTDSFTYLASDGTNQSIPVGVTLSITAVNAPPVALPDAYSGTQGTALIVPGPGVLGNDTDPNGTQLTAVLVTGPANGTLFLNPDGSFTYTPNPGFIGNDSFVYRASDGVNFSNPVAVTLAINAANGAPVALPDIYTGPQGVPLVIAGPGVLGNDTDPDGSPLTAVLVTGPANGTLVLNPNGSFTYTPNAGFVGTDTFTYRASDGTNLSNPVGVTVVVAAAISGPVALPDTYTTPSGSGLTIPGPGVLGNDSSPSGTPLTAQLVDGPTGGTLTLNPDGSFTYTPNAGFVGTDTFTYRATDGTNFSNPVAVTIAVTAVNGAPVALPDFYNGTEGTPLVIPGPGVLGNDFDPNGTPLIAVLVSGPANGTVTLNPDGSFVFIPNPGFVGRDSFIYRASDGTALSQPVTVVLSVGPAAAIAPQAAAVARFGFHAQPTSFYVQFNTALDPASAVDLSNYVLVSAGRDGRFGTRDDRRIVLRSATYDPATRSVSLTTGTRINLNGKYQLTLRGSGANPLRGATGLAVDGNGDGIGGDDQLIRISKLTLAGRADTPASQREGLARQIQLVRLSPMSGRLFAAKGRLYQSLRRLF
ncbi:Ig-like domain-containing protein [Tundrisphaera sp. TA3]|uniref:Ig-like domain-containing protein n=1 Tax=Tundrisphaera sp. TA3 TaxID=3435775 RepID=UPI003EBD2253